MLLLAGHSSHSYSEFNGSTPQKTFNVWKRKKKKPSEICFMNWKCDGVFNGQYKRFSFSLAVDLSMSLSQYFANLFCLRYRMGFAIKGFSFIRIFFLLWKKRSLRCRTILSFPCTFAFEPFNSCHLFIQRLNVASFLLNVPSFKL